MIDLANVRLSIEGGLLMAFGPDGDPITPDLLKEACDHQPNVRLTMSNGGAVEQDRLLAVIDAQQRSRLADHKNDRWIRAMLGLEGGFEDASDSDLESESRAQIRRLALGMPGGETITLHDVDLDNRRPDGEEPPSLAALLVDGRPTSVEAMIGLAGKPDHICPVTKPQVRCRGERLAFKLSDEIEAYIEAAPAIFDGQAKVDMRLSDGRQVSLDELADRLKDQAAFETAPVMQLASARFPLLGGEEPPFDLERATIVMVQGMPEGWSLTVGAESEPGLWMLAPADLAQAAVRTPGFPGQQTDLNVSVISLVGQSGALHREDHTLVMPPAGQSRAGRDRSSPAQAAPDRPVVDYRLAFGDHVRAEAAKADALLLRGVPEQATLSAGIADPSVRGWIVRPVDLASLHLLDVDPSIEMIEIELKAIHLDGKGRSHSKVIATKRLMPTAFQ